MASVTEQLTPAGQGNLQQIKAGKPNVQALFQRAEEPIKENEKLLFHILEKNKDTEYGKKYGFAQIHSIEDYQKKVPVSVYDDYAGYILRMSENGEENLITSGKVVHYNKSSGTVGNPKRIPLTEESFQIFQKLFIFTAFYLFNFHPYFFRCPCEKICKLKSSCCVSQPSITVINPSMRSPMIVHQNLQLPF